MFIKSCKKSIIKKWGKFNQKRLSDFKTSKEESKSMIGMLSKTIKNNIYRPWRKGNNNGWNSFMPWGNNKGRESGTLKVCLLIGLVRNSFKALKKPDKRNREDRKLLRRWGIMMSMFMSTSSLRSWLRSWILKHP